MSRRGPGQNLRRHAAPATGRATGARTIVLRIEADNLEERMAGCVVAVDVGGTFTDLALADLETGQLWTTKTPTTPHDQLQGFVAGVAKVLQQAGKAPG